MIKKFLTKIVGTSNERTLKRLEKVVTQINSLEGTIKLLSDEQLRNKTEEFRNRLQNGATLDEILPEAFAVVREASVRTLKLRHFDVQLIGGIILHEGKISEMRTGEGKTLVATLAAYLNALSQKGVHIVTVNDYLAKRDSNWMGPIYKFLGLSVGVILANQTTEEKKTAYACDITYGTNNEFGFDYLRDNMVFHFDDKVQRGLNFAIVDEVDSILIDEARTPLIISGPTEDSSELYIKINQLIPSLIRQEEKDKPGDYWVDEKNKQVFLSEVGHHRVEELFASSELLKNKESLYSANNIIFMHYLTASLKAHTLFHRDIEYIVKDGQIVIVDEHTGRTMEGRRWSDGLHQAIESKENVTIRNENQTLASITFQNYFRLYQKLAGMTGTADTEAFEFREIYGLEVVVIPTNVPMIRIDYPDQIYLTAKEKYHQIIESIKVCHTKQQPVLVGTISIENSEYLASMLTKEKIPHQVLNAKYHEREAAIIAQAGRPGAVTIATNMAGRGTDIVLGGNLEAELASLIAPTPMQIEKTIDEWQKRHNQVIHAGGLHILGSERHESRRIDNQLRGRAGRQGDAGSSRFYLSLEDNLMRIFASERVKLFMQRIGMKENEAIEHPFISKAIENAQRKVEGFNFDIRKQLLDYDNVANEQRKIVYEQRDELMRTTDISETINLIRENVVTNLTTTYIPLQSLEEQWDIDGLEKNLKQDFNIELSIRTWLEQDDHLYDELLRTKIYDAFVESYKSKETLIGEEVLRHLEKTVMLQLLDSHWKEHLAAMDHLREGIHLRGYAQQDPKQAYKRESFKLFTEMLKNLKYAVLSTIYTMQVNAENEVKEVEERQRKLAEEQQKKMHYIHQQAAFLQQKEQGELAKDAIARAATPIHTGLKVGRNDLCPCGSGKKYKHCCGKLD